MANFQTRIKNKHDTEAHWNSATNFTPLDGEIIVYDVDSNHPYPRYKVGDGNTVVTALPFSTDILDDYLKQVEYNKYQVLRNVAYNVTRFFTVTTPTEIVIYTKIRWISAAYMPVIHLYGYAYGAQSPIEFKVGFYIFQNTIGWCGATNMGAWNPDIFLFKYTASEDSLDYVALGLRKSVYFPQFEIDLQVEHGISLASISLDGWTTDSIVAGEESIIPPAGSQPDENCVQVPYKPIPGYVTDSSLSASLSNYVTRSTEQIIYAHKTFNSSASGTLPITVTSNDVSNQMGMSSTAIWNFDPSTSKWYSASLQAKNGILAYTSDIPETGNYVYGSDGVKNTNLSVISRDASNDRVYVGNDLDNLVLYGTSPHPYYSQTNGEFGVELALVSDIPNTSNFITNTQLDSAINGITIDDGTL